jgi:hypothetical protein
MQDLTTEDGVRAFIESEAMNIVRASFQQTGGDVPKFGFVIVRKNPDGSDGPADSMFFTPSAMLVRGDSDEIESSMKQVAEKLDALGAVFVSVGNMKTKKGTAKVVMIYVEHKFFGKIRFAAQVKDQVLKPFKDITTKMKFPESGFRFLPFTAN